MITNFKLFEQEDIDVFNISDIVKKHDNSEDFFREIRDLIVGCEIRINRKGITRGGNNIESKVIDFHPLSSKFCPWTEIKKCAGIHIGFLVGSSNAGSSLLLQDNNKITILSRPKRTKRIYTSEDPYGEEDWEVNEKFNFFEDVVMFPIKHREKISRVIDWPIVKYIEKKTKNLTEEEKLMKIAQIANTLDRWFSPFNSLVGGMIFFGIGSINALLHLKTAPPGMLEVYGLLIATVAYSSLNKEYRLLAKKNYRKIRKEFIENIDKIENVADPYGEEQWYDEEDIIARADATRYNKRFKHLEDMPYIGLHHRKDINP